MRKVNLISIAGVILLACLIACGSGGSDGNDNGHNNNDSNTNVDEATLPTTPIAGGCEAVNENPAAGTYSGDGGCGISDVAYQNTTQGTDNVIILNPFGVNGATSFAYSIAAPSTAASTRSDLTIKGEAGYSCAIACSPPATFTVSCFKEGGTTCTEKF